MPGIEIAQQLLEDGDDLPAHGDDVAADTRQVLGRGIQHAAVRVDRLHQGRLERVGYRRGLERRERRGLTGLAAQFGGHDPRRGERLRDRRQLGAVEHRALQPEPGERGADVGKRNGLQVGAAIEQAGHVEHAPQLERDPGDVGAGRERAHARRPQRGHGVLRDLVECGGKLDRGEGGLRERFGHQAALRSQSTCFTSGLLTPAAAALAAGGVHLPLATLARLLIVAVLAQVGQDAGFLALLLEALQRALEILVLVNHYFRHAMHPW
ncbi:MAG: hypothetical protein A2085_00645 [Gemmatimonadetes bacterium GWC2_71_10]|nr:MAG: hypothetical protein A2085_00645 [Gemmatimonadetes bacterium GWC2_71_10]